MDKSRGQGRCGAWKTPKCPLTGQSNNVLRGRVRSGSIQKILELKRSDCGGRSAWSSDRAPCSTSPCFRTTNANFWRVSAIVMTGSRPVNFEYLNASTMSGPLSCLARSLSGLLHDQVPLRVKHFFQEEFR